MQKKSVAVVGAGIVGLNLAYYLHLEGFEVTLLSKRSQSRASDAAQGLICNKGLLIPQTALFDAKIKSLSWVKDWLTQLEKHSGQAIQKDFSGILEPYATAKEFTTITKRVYRGSFWGLFGTQHSCNKYSPWSSPHQGFLYYRGDGWFNAQQALRALETFLRAEGVRWLDTKIGRIGVEASKVFAEGKNFRQDFDHIVLAAGFHNKALAEESKLPYPQQVKPVWGQTVKLSLDQDYGYWGIVKRSRSLLLRERQAFLGSSSVKVENPSQIQKVEALNELMAALETDFFAGTLGESSNIQVSEGVRSMTKDRQPYWGTLSEGPWQGRVSLVGGMYKSGLQFASFLSKQLVSSLRGGPVSSLSQTFSIARFS